MGISFQSAMAWEGGAFGNFGLSFLEVEIRPAMKIEALSWANNEPSEVRRYIV